jgi:hypothetical protein
MNKTKYSILSLNSPRSKLILPLLWGIVRHASTPFGSREFRELQHLVKTVKILLDYEDCFIKAVSIEI